MSKEAEDWMTVLKTHAQKSFKTIRIRPWKIKPSEADKLITHINRLVIEDTVKYVSLSVPGPTQLIFCWIQK